MKKMRLKGVKEWKRKERQRKNRMKSRRDQNSLSPSICQASAITFSRSPLLAEIVTISGCIDRGSMTLSVCAVDVDESVMSGVWFEGGILLVRSIGEGKESRFVFGKGVGIEETDTQGVRLVALDGGFRTADGESERVGGAGMCSANCRIVSGDRSRGLEGWSGDDGLELSFLDMMLAVLTGPVEYGVFEEFGVEYGLDGDVEPLDADVRGKKYWESVEEDDDCSAGKLAGFWLCEFGTRSEGGVCGAMTSQVTEWCGLRKLDPDKICEEQSQLEKGFRLLYP